MGKYCVKATLASTLAFADENPENLVGDAIVVRRNLIAQGEKEYGNKNRSLPSVKHALKEVEPVGPRRRLACGFCGTPPPLPAPEAIALRKKDCVLEPGKNYLQINNYEKLLKRRNDLHGLKTKHPEVELKPLWDIACKTENQFFEAMTSNEVTFDGKFMYSGNTTSVKLRNNAYDELVNKIEDKVAQKNQKIEESNLELLKGLMVQANDFKEKLGTSAINDDNELTEMFAAMETISLEGSVGQEDVDKVENLLNHINQNYYQDDTAKDIEILKNNRMNLKQVIEWSSKHLKNATTEEKKIDEKDIETYKKMLKVTENMMKFLMDKNCNPKQMVNIYHYEEIRKYLDNPNDYKTEVQLSKLQKFWKGVVEGAKDVVEGAEKGFKWVGAEEEFKNVKNLVSASWRDTFGSGKKPPKDCLNDANR